MKGEKNNFRKGLFISLGLHLLIVCLLALGVGRHGQVSPEQSIEVSLSTQVPRASKKKSVVKAPSRPKKPEKSAKKIKKPAKEQVKPPQKKKKADPVTAKKEKSPDPPTPQTKPDEKPKEPAAASEETPPRTEPETEKEEAVAEKKALESEKKEVIRNIKKESVLSDIKKSAEQASVEPASKESAPGVISLVLDVYYRTISKRIQRSLVLPLNIDSGILLAAQVNFYMKETGEVYNVGIERSSGNLKFDSYCIKAVNDASPLPPPPSELRERIKSDFFVISCESKK
ncbi:MAG: TonB family protein [Candidatus Dadabacteria bacterium]|nr:TonB family protein [Candidatus Dadabacteria bacterium]MYB26471.1 TonB family protein [Candidatus Dadabacteria bacterium]